MDRLSELRRLSGLVPSAEPARPIPAADVPRESIEVLVLGVQRSDSAAADVETASRASAAPIPVEMERFFDSLGGAKSQLAGLRRQLDGLEELLRKFKAEFNPQTQGRVRVEIEAAVAALHSDLSRCQVNLQGMQNELDSAEAQLPPDYSGSDLRAQKTLVARLRQDAASLVEKFMRLQKAHETWHHATVRRQVEIVGSALTDGEKAAVAEDCLERGVSVFKEEVEGSLRKKQAEIQRQVEAQHAGAVQVERDIAALAKLFESFSLLVNTQGEAIDLVEAHVRGTATSLLQGGQPGGAVTRRGVLQCSCGKLRSIRQQVRISSRGQSGKRTGDGRRREMRPRRMPSA